MATDDILTGNFAPVRWMVWPRSSLRIVDWNIDRGLQLQAIIDFLASVNADVCILQEVDINARRTQHLNIAEEIARSFRWTLCLDASFRNSSRDPTRHPRSMAKLLFQNGPFLICV